MNRQLFIKLLLIQSLLRHIQLEQRPSSVPVEEGIGDQNQSDQKLMDKQSLKWASQEKMVAIHGKHNQAKGVQGDAHKMAKFLSVGGDQQYQENCAKRKDCSDIKEPLGIIDLDIRKVGKQGNPANGCEKSLHAILASMEKLTTLPFDEF